MADSDSSKSKTIVSTPVYKNTKISTTDYEKGLNDGSISTRDYISGNASGIVIKKKIGEVQQDQSTVPFSPSSINTDGNTNITYDNLNFVPDENPLNSIDQSTYHIKLSVLPDIAEVKKEIVIAETGSTELNIQNLTVDSYVGPDLNTKNSSMSKMDIEILEFYGFSLMDRIVQSASTLKVRNYQKTPFKLEIKFVGRDPSTGVALDNALPGKVWAWKILISKMNTKVTEAGCVHKLEMYPISDLAGTDDYMRIPESYSATGRTCGDILTDLFGKLSADINAKYGNIPMVKYRVGGLPYPSSSQSPVPTPLDHVVTNQNIMDTTRNPDNASMSTGIAINELVDILLANSETAVKLANGVGTSSAISVTESGKVHSTMCRVEKVVEYGNYIDIFNDYEKVISYILVPYDTVRLINNFDQYQNINDPKRTSARIQYMNSCGFMKKEYDYIFTGENTEILSFDIDLAFDYYTSVEIMLGTMSYSSRTQGQAFNQHAKEVTDAASYQSYVSQIQELRNKKNRSTQENTDLATLQRKVDLMKSSVEASAAASEYRDKQRIASAVKDLSNRDQTTYADDEDYSQAMNNLQKLPVTLRQTPGIMASMDGVVEGNYDTRRAIYAALLDQLYGNIDTNLASIKIEIKGDPYWMGKAQYHDLFSNGLSVLGKATTVLGYPVDAIDPKESYANYATGENVFVLRYKVPQGFDESTGRPIIKENETYTGFYSVSHVENRFINGFFSQIIYGFRIPSAAVSSVLKDKKITSNSTSTTSLSNPNTNLSTTTNKIANAINSVSLKTK